MLFKEITVLCSEKYNEFTNTLYGQNADPVNVKAGGTYIRN
jgi:hypothetical protein